MTADAPSPTAGGPRASAGRVLTINGGSSSIKFAVFGPPADGATGAHRSLSGSVDRIGSPRARLTAKGQQGDAPESEPIDASDHEQGAERLAEWLRQKLG